MTLHTVTITGLRDLAGNALVTPTTTTFTTRGGADLAAPTLVSSVPVSSASGVPRNVVSQLVFNERLSAASVSAQSVYLQDQTTGQRVSATVSLSADARTVTLAPSVLLEANRSCRLNYLVEDLAGNARNSSFPFTTAQ